MCFQEGIMNTYYKCQYKKFFEHDETDRKILKKKKSLRHMIGGNVVNSFSNNFIKGEMKIKSIKILKTSYFVQLSVILNLFL